jgi:hypothetical protein
MKQLVEFKDTHGHVRVPVNDAILGVWVSQQREEYRKHQNGEACGLVGDRLKELTDLGFVFVAGKRKGKLKEPRKTWDERFQELLDYKEMHGDCLVPQHWPVLGRWVHDQRNQYKRLKRGDYSPLNHEKALKLTDVGFVFDTRQQKRNKFD